MKTGWPLFQVFPPGKDRRNEEDSHFRLRRHGGAILSGCLAKGLWKKEEIYVKEHSEEASREKASRYGVHASMDGREAKEADLVILAVKPMWYPECFRKYPGIIHPGFFLLRRRLPLHLWKGPFRKKPR